MSTPSSFFLSEPSLRTLKRDARRRLPNVSSSHVSEGIASALGFATFAALRAALVGHPTVEVQKPRGEKLQERLRQLGYADQPNALAALPTLDVSYTPFRTSPLNRRSGVRWRALRNLLVATINAGLEQRHFGLLPGQDWWLGAEERQTLRYRFDIVPGIPVAASVRPISGDELAFHTVLHPRRDDVEADFASEEDGDALGHCWLERRLGAWIQDFSQEGLHCKRAKLHWLAGIEVRPTSYSDQGSFIL